MGNEPKLERKAILAKAPTWGMSGQNYVGHSEGVAEGKIQETADQLAESWYKLIPKVGPEKKDPITIVAVLCVADLGCWGGNIPKGAK